jgi:hypothetical protein
VCFCVCAWSPFPENNGGNVISYDYGVMCNGYSVTRNVSCDVVSNGSSVTSNG